MQIIEKSIIAKNPKKKSEDGIVVNDNFVAVIDGSTSKSQYRHSWFYSNGRYAMLLVSRYIQKMPKATNSEAFFRGVTAYVRKHYKKSMMPRLAAHPEDRLTCSAVVYSRLNREIWMVGDCQCLINGELYDNPKPAEAELAAMRAAEVKRLLATGMTQEELLQNDIARALSFHGCWRPCNSKISPIALLMVSPLTDCMFASFPSTSALGKSFWQAMAILCFALRCRRVKKCLASNAKKTR